jgi:hypothetical protein
MAGISRSMFSNVLPVKMKLRYFPMNSVFAAANAVAMSTGKKSPVVLNGVPEPGSVWEKPVGSSLKANVKRYSLPLVRPLPQALANYQIKSIVGQLELF